MEDEAEMQRKFELYQQKNGRRAGSGNFDDLMEQTDESDYDQEDEDINEEDEEKMKKFSKFNFSGMSFKDYVGSVRKQKQLKNEMTKIV